MKHERRKVNISDCEESNCCPILNAIEKPQRANDPVRRDEVENMKEYLIQVGNHELVLTNMAHNFETLTDAVKSNSRRMNKLEECSKELQQKVDSTREEIKPAIDGLVSLDKTVKFLEPFVKIGGWIIGIATAIGGVYAYITHFKGHQ